MRRSSRSSSSGTAGRRGWPFSGLLLVRWRVGGVRRGGGKGDAAAQASGGGTVAQVLAGQVETSRMNTASWWSSGMGGAVVVIGR